MSDASKTATDRNSIAQTYAEREAAKFHAGDSIYDVAERGVLVGYDARDEEVTRLKDAIKEMSAKARAIGTRFNPVGVMGDHALKGVSK